MQLNLNIYKGKTIEKVYTANEFDIMFGTVEDLISLIDVDRLTGDISDADFVTAIMLVLRNGFDQVKTLIQEIFPDVTDEELRRTKIKEVAMVIVQVLKYGFKSMAAAGNSKN